MECWVSGHCWVCKHLEKEGWGEGGGGGGGEGGRERKYNKKILLC